MQRGFRNGSTQKVDAKGRVSFPAPFRRELETGDPDWQEGLRPQLVIVYGDHRRKYLECYTIDAISDVDARISKMKRGTIERRMLEHMFNGQALPTEVDKDGRLVLPQKLREKIGLEKEAFFIGSGDTFQIWHPQTYEEVQLKEAEAYLDDQPENFDIVTLLGANEGE